MGAVRTWWDGREPRERVLLGLLGAIFGLFILIFGAVLPTLNARASADQALRTAQAEYRLVARTLPSASQTGSRQSFNRAALLQAARDQGVSLSRIQPGSDGSFAVWIDDAPTQDLYALFETLLNDTTAQFDRVVVSSAADGGLSAQFTVSSN